MFMQMIEFRDSLIKHTVKYIACSLKWYITYACVLNGCDVIAVPQSNGVCYCCRVYQHSANNRWIFTTGLSQSNQRSVYENEYVRKAATCVLIGIAQLVEHPAKTDQLTFIKRHPAFESRKLRLLFSFLFVYLSFIYIFLYILLLFSFICLFYFL